MGVEARAAWLLALALAAAPLQERESASPDRIPVDLQKRLGDVEVERTPQGDVVVLPAPDGTLRMTPAEFADGIYEAHREQRRHGVLFTLFNITTIWGVLWVAVGFLGQALFMARMLLQWWASEKVARSVVPEAFWWSSLIGGAMLLAYFVWRKDIVGIAGQSTGVLVYARNLVLIRRNRRSPTAELARGA